MAFNDSALLARVARRIRELRSRAGLTAREAAARSGLSLRFYHHLEAGTANVSITKLSHVAAVFKTALSELLKDDSIRPIALLGLRGAGKSTIGPRLARLLGCRFIELDKRIEKAAGLPLSKIFTLHGEGYYRRMQSRCLRDILAEGEMCVIELPGGIVADESLFQHVKGSCLTVWLRARPEDHMNRVYLQGDTRPMANRKNAMDELREILREREPLYRSADLMVDTSALTINGALQTIKRFLAKANHSASRPRECTGRLKTRIPGLPAGRQGYRPKSLKSD